MAKQCRICLGDDDQDALIKPCLCDGSSRYVHRACLDEWRSVKTHPLAFRQCSICKFQYRVLHKRPEPECGLWTLWIFRFHVVKDICFLFVFVNGIVVPLTYIIKSLADRNELYMLPFMVLPGMDTAFSYAMNLNFELNQHQSLSYLQSYSIAAVCSLFIFSIASVVLYLRGGYFPDDFTFPVFMQDWRETLQQCLQRGPRGPIFCCCGGNFVCRLLGPFFFVLILIVGVIFSLASGAYLAKCVMERHWHYNWHFKETEKQVVKDLEHAEILLSS